MMFGVLAASLGAGRLLKLDAAGLNNALGIAFHQASGSAQSMRDGVLSKRLGAGFAARAAVLGAFLAADGITGTRRTLEGNAGPRRALRAGRSAPGIAVRGPGPGLAHPGVQLQALPLLPLQPHGDRARHPAARGGRARRTTWSPPRSGWANVNWLTVGEPYDVKRDSVVHAQFNAAYSFARALADGRVDLRSYQRPQITDPAVAALAGAHPRRFGPGDRAHRDRARARRS